MRFSRETLGLPVIHADSGHELGKVREWLLDERGELMLAFLAEDGGWLPQRRVFSYHKIIVLGQDVILVDKEGDHAVGDPPAIDGAPTYRVMGKRVISRSGNELGVVEDVLFEEETGRVSGWRLSSGLIEDILHGRQVLEQAPQVNIGEDVMIFRD